MNILELALNVGGAAVAVALLLSAWRLLVGPTVTDRILALNTLYLCVVALVVLLRDALAPRFCSGSAPHCHAGFCRYGGAGARYVTRGDVVE
ncbi:MAG: K+/H+ antiporter subunit F [Burkholderiaceae bacterium]